MVFKGFRVFEGLGFFKRNWVYSDLGLIMVLEHFWGCVGLEG